VGPAQSKRRQEKIYNLVRGKKKGEKGIDVWETGIKRRTEASRKVKKILFTGGE